MKYISIITGASSGMGAEFARQMKDICCSDEIWLLARRKDRLDKLASELNTGQQPVVKTFSVDLAGRAGVECFKAIFDTESKQSIDSLRIRMLVNNAGFGTYGTFENTNLKKELEMIELNCVSLTGICGVALPFMDSTSVIINVSSLAAVMPLGNFAVYAATKSYVLSFTLSLAAEVFDRGIKVCALCPGSVSTEFANIASNGARAKVLHGKPVDKVVSHCLKKALKGCHIAMMSPKWKFNAFISRFLSHYFGARMTYKYAKRPSNPIPD